MSSAQQELVPPVDEQLSLTRPISWMGIASLLLALGSVSVLLSSCFVVVPVIAVLLGLVALWQTYAVEPLPRGRGAAWLGVFLGMAVASSVLAYQTTTSFVWERQVDRIFEHFVQLLQQGKYDLAYQMTLTPELRSTSPDEVPQAPGAGSGQNFLGFRDRFEIRFLAESKQVDILSALTEARLPNHQGQHVIARSYRLKVLRKNGTSKLVTAEVAFARDQKKSGLGDWRISSFSIPLQQLFDR